MLDALRATAERACAERLFPGCVIGVVRRGESPNFIAVGGHTYDVNARAATPGTLYDLASVTKSVPTASLALVLAEERKLSLEDRVREFLPGLQNDFDATLRDLMLYRVHGPRLSELRDLPADDMLAVLLERGFEGPPGESTYTNLPALMLGLAIESSMNTTLDILARRYFFDPLKMAETSFYAGAPLTRAAPTEMENWRGVVAGVTHDESAYTLARAGRIAGHAGLFSTAGDILAFLGALLEAKDARMKAVAKGAQEGLGWQLDQPYFMGEYAGPRTFGKTGFTGTSVVVDMGRGIAFVILSNRTYPTRPPEDSAIHAFRARIADIILEALH